MIKSKTKSKSEKQTPEQEKVSPKEPSRVEENNKATTKLEEYLKNKAKEHDPKSVKISKIFGINFHIPLLGLLDLLSLGLLLAMMFYNIDLNWDSGLYGSLEEFLSQYGWVGNIYFNCLIFMLLGILIAWGYNLALNWPFNIFKEELLYRRARRVLYVIFIFFSFMVFFIYLMYVNPILTTLLLVLLFLMIPVLLGAIGIIINNRGYIITSFIFTIIFALFYQNTSLEILDLVIFAVLAFLFLEISESKFKFKTVYAELNPNRDMHDHQVLNNTVSNYLLILAIMIGFIAVFTYLIFYSQPVLRSILPIEIANSLEFNSAVFVLIPLILLGFIIALTKWMLLKIQFKSTSK